MLFYAHADYIHADSPSALKLDHHDALFTFFSLPDGEAMLIQTGEGKTYLVNTASPKSQQDLMTQLHHFGVNQIDHLMITSHNRTECGNINRIVKRYHVEEIYYGATSKQECIKQSYRTKAKEWKINETHALSKKVTVKPVAATSDGFLSLYFTYEDTSLLFLGSGDLSLERQLMKDSALHAEILKIGGYAKTKSPTTSFLEKIDPHIAFIYPLHGVLPNEGLLERLEESWIDVYVLRKVGTTSVHFSNADYELYPK